MKGGGGEKGSRLKVQGSSKVVDTVDKGYGGWGLGDVGGSPPYPSPAERGTIRIPQGTAGGARCSAPRSRSH